MVVVGGRCGVMEWWCCDGVVMELWGGGVVMEWWCCDRVVVL